MTDRSLGHNRIWFLYSVVIFIAVVLIGQLYLLQVVRGGEYRDKAEKKYQSLISQFERNTIYFTEKDGNLVSAATTRTGFFVELNPDQISNAEEVYLKLKDIIPLERDAFLLQATKKRDKSEIIAHRLPEATAEKIQELKIIGVGVFRENWRYYPSETLGAHVLGFMGYEQDGKTLSGRYGLERYYDPVLNKSNGGSRRNFFAEAFSSVKTAVDPTEKIKGDIALTIEPTVQSELEKRLDYIKTKYSSGEVGGIIINPKTGEIYAMGVVPRFDPNDVSKEDNVSVFNDPLVENTYEMGSVVKPLVMAAGIDAGKVNAKTTYNDSLGYLTIDKKKISNYDGKGRGQNIPMQEVLNQSLNTGMVFVMKQMGKESFAKYMNAYELGETTRIDLPGEVPGNIENLKRSTLVESATASFGQGISLTPIGVTRALCSLGNGGTLVEPHILKSTLYPAGITKEYPIEEGPHVLKQQTSEDITRMLVTVVDKALLNGTVKMPNYSIAAKTGTAQISQGGGAGYYSDRYLHSFFGYFPAYDPKFLVFLYVVNPRGEEYASHTLTAPFMELTKFLLTYYEVPPDR
ncbi:MAG: penicillin-binding protein 2 [Candidatus Parcubacteria bacterium]|nr:penicillin-binding protein 2 [Candidatus Parcubacteria bacterium]